MMRDSSDGSGYAANLNRTAAVLFASRARVLTRERCRSFLS
jgi:hypothetical protein